jgi:hypothetical protein
MVLSMTLSDGSNIKYLIKVPERNSEAPSTQAASAVPGDVAIEKISKWEVERLGTALSVGDNALPLGVALKISNLATVSQ